MGQDPVLVTRGADGKIRAFLNMCRHRGNRVCRGEAGNATTFTCPYHGWSFRNDGALDFVPGYKEVYLERLDMAAHGLVPVAQLDTYKGLIFATFDASAPSLTDYLGDMAWYLDMILDRREGGIEFIPGVHKWRLNCNWKLPTDNFIGDSYHGPVSHISAWQNGFEGMPRRKKGYGYEGFQISPGGGHGFGTRWAENEEQIYEMVLPEFLAYEKERAPETHEAARALARHAPVADARLDLPQHLAAVAVGKLARLASARADADGSLELVLRRQEGQPRASQARVRSRPAAARHVRHLGAGRRRQLGADDERVAKAMPAARSGRTCRWASATRSTQPRSIPTCAAAIGKFQSEINQRASMANGRG